MLALRTVGVHYSQGGRRRERKEIFFLSLSTARKLLPIAERASLFSTAGNTYLSRKRFVGGRKQKKKNISRPRSRKSLSYRVASKMFFARSLKAPFQCAKIHLPQKSHNNGAWKKKISISVPFKWISLFHFAAVLSVKVGLSCLFFISPWKKRGERLVILFLFFVFHQDLFAPFP